MRQARQRQSQVCGVHGRASSGFGQQVQLRALSIPEPGAMAISPGRRVFRRLTRPHRPWPGCQAPTNPPSRRARPSRSRIAVPPYSPPVGPAGHGLVRSVPCRRWPTRPAPWRSQSPVRAAQQGRASEADKVGRRWSAWGRSHPPRGMQRPVRRPGPNTSMTRNGNQIRPAWPGAATRDENRVGPLPSPRPSATTSISNPSPHDPGDFPFRVLDPA